MRETLSDRAYTAIKADIITCEFKPGQQIAQPHLAERYEIGETPVREALHRLAQEGLVESVPRYGYVVAPISYSNVVDIYEVRLILESATARMAADRASLDDIDRIIASQDFDHQTGDRTSYLEFLSRNVAFHCQVAAASGNDRLEVMISQLHDESTRVLHLGLKLDSDAELTREEHILIGKAIRDRDGDRAESLMQRHIAHAQDRVLDALSRHFGIRRPGISSLDTNQRAR